MTIAKSRSREIDGDGRTVRQLLVARRRSSDYYQCECNWQTKRVIEPIDDLVEKFQDSWEPDRERSASLSTAITSLAPSS